MGDGAMLAAHICRKGDSSADSEGSPDSAYSQSLQRVGTESNSGTKNLSVVNWV
jgi:hypothetical protein